MPKDGYLICFSTPLQKKKPKKNPKKTHQKQIKQKQNKTKNKEKKPKPTTKKKNLSTYPDLKRKQWLRAAKSWGFGEGNVC